MNIGILGVSGFIGSHLLKSLCGSGYSVTGFSRREPKFMRGEFNWVQIADLKDETSFNWLLENKLDVLIDCSDPAVFSNRGDIQAHVLLKRKLYEVAIDAGVSKYIYLSSIKAYAEISIEPINELSHPRPVSRYGQMKLAVEGELKNLAKTTNVDLACVRLPLVYGKGGGRSIRALASLIRLGIPLPFSEAGNLRSVISITNLCSFMGVVLKRSDVKNQDWFVSDLNPISTNEMVISIGACLGIKPRLFRLPGKIVSFCLSSVGLKNIAFSLLDNLEVDDSQARKLLDWVPEKFNSNDLCRSLEVK